MPRGQDAYESLLLTCINTHGGKGACWPLNDFLATSGPQLGVMQELTKRHMGSLPGLLYYNAMDVVGTLNPDATGKYTVKQSGPYSPVYQKVGTNITLYDDGLNSKIYDASTGKYWQTAGDVPLDSEYSPFNGASGVATVSNDLDSGVYSYTGSGGVTLQTPGPVINGDIVKAATFDGLAGFVASRYPVVTMYGAYTISMWVKGGSQTTKGIFSNGSTNSSKLMFFMFASGTKLSIFFRNNENSTRLSKTSTTDVFNSQWHHIVFTVNNGVAALYIDGQRDSTNFNFTPSGTTTCNICGIGILIQNHYLYYFNGSIAYVTVLEEALSEIEVKALFEGAKGL